MEKYKITELKIAPGKRSNWVEMAVYRQANRKWLKYSSKIALRILAKMEDNPELTKHELAKKLGISTYKINKIFRGQCNLTLELIGKLSNILEVELIEFPKYKYS